MKAEPAMQDEKDSKKGPDEWQVKNWAETVLDGEKIKADPKKMKHVKKHLKGHQKAIGKIVSTDQLRSLAKEKMESEGDEAGESPDEEKAEKKKGIEV